ncbi:putative orfan [Tupanvirus soda lake]|uniref:Orfan n=2 Tax=Tupanvirus TaxID=2094720 RepID=A0AC62ACV1_9VIRU|nr:putative orfan [Tupanvirus soda lake]QKU35517.1 putative orfan [Tupanvirus soda lake]
MIRLSIDFENISIRYSILSLSVMCTILDAEIYSTLSIGILVAISQTIDVFPDLCVPSIHIITGYGFDLIYSITDDMSILSVSVNCFFSLFFNSALILFLFLNKGFILVNESKKSLIPIVIFSIFFALSIISLKSICEPKTF